MAPMKNIRIHIAEHVVQWKWQSPLGGKDLLLIVKHVRLKIVMAYIV